jgi:transposase-like protein
MKEVMNLVELIKDFTDESKCRTYLERLRWPKGIECLECGSRRVYRILKRNQFVCDACSHQFSVTAKTIFHDTHLPLWKWFLATYLLCESRKGMSANQMKRQLDVSYKTAWYLCHRIRHAMIETGKPRLDGVVEMDETYVGGYKRGGRGPHASEKEIVIGIRKRNGDLRLFHTKDTKSATLAQFIRENISENVDVIITDDWVGYPKAMIKAGFTGKRHKTINHSGHVYVSGNVHTNTVESAFSLLKRGIMGTWHKLSVKHLASYLDEMCFRFNNRENPFLFRDTMLKLIGSPNLEYKELTAKVEAAA